jgi:hypothetical protein
MHKAKIVLIAIAVLIVAAVLFASYHSVVYRTEVSGFNIKASLVDAAGTAPNSHFILTTTAPLSTQVLEKYLKISPALDFSVKKVEAAVNTYEIVPTADLKADQIYTIKVDKGPLADHDFSWAYQVKAPFAILSSIPGDRGIDVPVNTGIEINFNRSDIVDPAGSIEINPSVAGRFESTGSMVRFIPEKPLAEKTIYTVKIKAGLGTKGSTDKLSEEKTIRFQTSISYSYGTPYANFSRDFSEFNTGSDIVLGVNSDKISTIETTVYRFASEKAFMDAVAKAWSGESWARSYLKIDQNLVGNDVAFTGTLPLETSNYYLKFKLPQTLSAGFYAVVIGVGDNKDVTWLQVNPAASFVALSGRQSLIWLKDISSGNNLPGVPIAFEGRPIGVTGSDGVLLFDTPAVLMSTSTDTYFNVKKKFFVAKAPGGDLVIPTENEYGSAASLSPIGNIWQYVSINKNVYLPTDTINFWSILKPRMGTTKIDEVSVKLTSSYWGNNNQENITTYAEGKFKVSDYNTVTGKLDYSNLKPGYYVLTFFNGSEAIARQSVTVSAYIKPAYKLIVTPDKYSMFEGESVAFKVKAEFFDGTPVANTRISYNAFGTNITSVSSKQDVITLGADGQGSFEIQTKYDANSQYWPQYLSVEVRPEKSEEGQIQANETVFVFGPHIYNEISQKDSVSKVDFTVKTREVDPNKSPREGRPYWYSEEYLGAPVASAITKAEIYEVVYKQEQKDTGYDAVNKLTYPIYHYYTEENLLSSPTITADQNGLATLSFNTEKNKTYKFVFKTADSLGRIVANTEYVWGGYSGGDNYGSNDRDYSLADKNNNEPRKIGDRIDLLLQTSEGVAPPDGRENYIFLTVNNGSIDYHIQGTPQYSSTFRNQDIPNIGIWPGWFAGGRFHNSYVHNISFDANERRLNISITKDKPSYLPGDNIGLDVRVTDKNGKPVKAEVNLSALDEAVFSMDQNEVDVVNDLYSDIYSELIIRSSNQPPYNGGGAEKGGGGDGGPRSNIQEMAIYRSVETDNNGFAHIDFKLPDNITSWRLTSQAVTKDLYAGKDVSFIPVTLPFFIDATHNNTYLVGDELVLRLRAFGSAANQGNIDYTVTCPTLAFKEIKQTGGNSVEISLGKLTAGNHEITVSAKNGKYQDSLIRKLNVLNSYFTKATSDYYDAQNGFKIKKLVSGYTTLSFSSAGRGRLYGDIQSINYGWGNRLDQDGSQMIAVGLLKEYFKEKLDLPDFTDSKYQNYSGGLQLLPYSSEDLELSALGAHLFDGSRFDRVALKQYLTNSLNDEKVDSSRITRALYGLAAFSEPVLTKIQAIENDKTLTLRDKVFVALSLDSIGAKEEARTYYRQMIKPSIVTKAPYKYVNGTNGDETITTTSLVAALTASFGEPEYVELGAYVSYGESNLKETTGNFERLLYLEAALPKLDPEDVTFTYKTAGKEETKTLKNGETYEVTLSPQELSTFVVTSVSGKLGIISRYEEQVSPKSLATKTDISLSRSYYVNNSSDTPIVSANEFKEGDLVMVKLSPKFNQGSLEGNYEIIDHLPSGLRPVGEVWGVNYDTYEMKVYPVEINDQKVAFVFDKTITKPIYYYARVVTKGTYKAEPAVLESMQSLEEIAISNEDIIKIK